MCCDRACVHVCVSVYDCEWVSHMVKEQVSRVKLGRFERNVICIYLKLINILKNHVSLTLF